MSTFWNSRGCPVRALATLLLAAAVPAAAHAQGSVGTQGFGYPLGQLSTRADGTAGASSPFDAESPLNPAALVRVGASVLHVQYSPEFRTVRVGGATERTTFSRFPLIVAAVPVGARTALGLAASTLLDRSFATTTNVPQQVADTIVQTRQTRRSTGGITDVRVSAARALTPRFSVGLAVHGYTGENRVTVRLADDSARFVAFDDSVRLNYGGLAASAGVDWRVSRTFAVAGSYKRGGTLRVRDESTDELLGEGKVPDRLGGGMLYEGIAGTALVASAGWQRWSAMNALTPSSPRARDALDVSVGAEARGPRFWQGSIAFRAGAAWRELPFPVAGEGDADELSLALGAGIPLAYNRATLDLSARRASRSAGDARETGWMLGIGLSVRP
jgi:hypothetical protein